MDTLYIAALERSPLVDFNFSTAHFRLVGESYPEDASLVFGPVFNALNDFLAQPREQTVRFDIELVYFNSSSAKALMNMFKLLNEAGKRGQKIEVNWYFDAEDETMREFGEDFGEDLLQLTFNLVETNGS